MVRIAGAFCLVLLSLSPAAAQKPASDIMQRSLKQLQSTAPKVRADAANALGQMGVGAKTAVPALIVALGDTNKDVRSTVADALGSIGAPASHAVPALLAALRDKVSDVRSSAANALGQIGVTTPTVVHALLATLKDNDSNVRSSVADALGSLGMQASEAIPALIELLKDEESDVRSNAADALGKMGTDAKAAAPALIEALNDNAHDVRASAADALGQIGVTTPTVVHALLATLKDNDSNTRSTAVDALGQMGREAKAAVPALIVTLGDRDESVRNTVADVLGNLGTDAREAVPALKVALDDPSINVSYSAVIALGKMRTEAVPAVPTLRKKLAAADIRVRRAAADVLGNLGTQAKDAVPELIGALNDNDRDFRANAADALRKIGTAPLSAVPALIAALRDADPYARASAASVLGNMGAAATPAVPTLRAECADGDTGVRRSSAEALGNIGTAAVSAVPYLIAALNDGESDVRRAAVVALGKIGTSDASAINALDHVLLHDDPAARNSAAYVLGRMGAAAGRTVPDLISALNDPNDTVKVSSLVALREICVSSQGSAPQLSDAQLQALLDEMDQVKRALPQLSDNKTLDATYALDTQKRLDQAEQTFQTELRSSVRARNARALRLSPVGIGIVAWLSVVVVGNALLLAFWPLALLRINDGMKRYGSLRGQGRGRDISLPFRLALGVGFLHYLPRVLDAWVRRYADTARAQLLARPTFKEREVYVDMPVLWQGESCCLLPADMQRLFAHSSAGLLLWGEGGSGKTTLVCQMALWALEANPFQRLCATHRMLPLFIEENLPVANGQDSEGFLAALQFRLHQLTGEANPPSLDLVRNLLQKRRVLLIVDGISEMDADTRSLFLTANAALPLNTLLVTSRAEERLCSAHTETIQTRLIQWNQVSAFLWDYLGQCEKRDLFSRDEIYAGLWRFSTLVGEREITALLARLYAQHMIDFKEQPNAEHPHSIPELMDAYINELCRKADKKRYKRYEIHQIARIAAWECLRTTYTPVEAPLENVEQALSAPPDTAHVRPYQRDPRAAIAFFVDDLHLLQKFGMDGSRVKFSLDPPSEYLAARHLVVTLYRDDVARWDAFFADAASRPNAPRSIAGFLIALRDTWEAFGAEGEVKEHVLGNMHRLFGAVLPDAAPTQASQGMSLWISLLESTRKEDCLLALEELEKLGEAARPALPTLERVITHRDAEVQQRGAALLERLRIPA